MKILIKKEPFEHIIIKDMYDEQERHLIFREAEFLFTKLGDPEKTRAALNVDGTHKKSGRGLFVDDLYTDRGLSDLLNVTRKPYGMVELRKAMEELGLYYKLFNETNHDCTLLQYYENDDHYDSHTDKSIFTIIYTFYKEPKCFRGGDLCFEDYEYYIPIENNQLVLFPSLISHRVTKVTMDKDLYMGGRFSIANLVNWKI